MSRADTPLSETVLALRREFDLAFARAPRTTTERLEGLLALRIDGDPYAVRVSEIDGLHVDRRIMALPSPVAELLGVAGFRGQIAPVYDLAALLGYARVASPRWLLQLHSRANEPLALAFDTFEMHFSVSPEQLVSSPGALPSQGGTTRAHLFDAVRGDAVVRPIIPLRSLLQDIQSRVDSFHPT